MTPTDNLFWPYLLPILEAQKAAHGVSYIAMSDANGMDRMLEDSRSEDVYPGIFVFRPKYTGKMVENHIPMLLFNVQMYVWCHGSLDDRQVQDQAFAHAERIISPIIQQMQHDMRAYQNFLDFDSISIEPILYLGSDAAYGYELRFQIGLPANEIYC